MSVQVLSWAISQKTGSPSLKAVLLALANYAGTEGVSRPSYQTIADHTELSRRTVIRSVEALVRAGLIEKVASERLDGGDEANGYRFRVGATPSPRKGSGSWEPSRPLRRRLIAAAGGKCVACGSDDRLCIDHIIPRSKGGSNEETNLQVLCLRCNSSKRHRLNWAGRRV